MNILLRAEGLMKTYGAGQSAVKALNGVSLEIREGELLVILGSSGSGKSTLLNMLGGMDRPDKGSILFRGKEISRLNDRGLTAYRRKNIGFVFQFHHLLPEFSAVENVALPAMIAGQSKSTALKRAEELLEYLKLKDRLTHKPSQLSGGEQQRVAVARALVNSPKIILADEPSGNLDTENARKLHQLFFDLRDQFKQTFIVVTHNTELATMADKTIHMKDGKIEK